MNPFQIGPDEVNEWIVMPPIGDRFDDPKLMAAVKAALQDRFPQHTFWLAADMSADAGRQEAFTVIPVIGSTGDRPTKRMPGMHVLAEIALFLFDNFVDVPRYH